MSGASRETIIDERIRTLESQVAALIATVKVLTEDWEESAKTELIKATEDYARAHESRRYGVKMFTLEEGCLDCANAICDSCDSLYHTTCPYCQRTRHLVKLPSTAFVWQCPGCGRAADPREEVV